jgi:3-hydroxyisobutyrate dehydrogenase-like beta-hydroxyacid dehydrogenase
MMKMRHTPGQNSVIGWIGVGKIGGPMCRQIVRAGYPVFVNDPLPENRAIVVAEGARVVATLDELVDQSDIIVSTLAEDAVLNAVVFGERGLAELLRPDQIYIDMSTISPQTSADIANAMMARRIPYLRAPFSGSIANANKGELTVFASGSNQAWNRVKPVMMSFAANIFWVGEQEEARYLKLAINTLLGGISSLLSEALAIGRRGNLSTETMLDVMCESVVGSPLLRDKKDAIIANNYEASFSVAQMINDISLINEVALSGGVPMMLLNLVKQQYEHLRKAGLSDSDYFVLVEQHERIVRNMQAEPMG